MAQRQRAPFRIGICQDLGCGTQAIRDQYDAVRLAFDEAFQSNLLDRSVDLIIREIDGPPETSPQKVINAWRELVHNEKCLAVIGPHTSDAAIALKEEVDAAQVPTLSYCGTRHWGGPYCFSMIGTLGDEAALLVDLVLRRDYAHTVVLSDRSAAGDESLQAFSMVARERGLPLASVQSLPSPGSESTQIDGALRAAREQNADCIVYLGDSSSLQALVTAIDAVAANSGWKPQLLLNSTLSSLSSGLHDPQVALDSLSGTIGLDGFHEDNSVFRSLLERVQARHNRSARHRYTAQGWDMGNALAHALSRAKPYSRDGLKSALEAVRWLPAAGGNARTVISFGPWDHRGYKGEYLVTRIVENGATKALNVPTLFNPAGAET